MSLFGKIIARNKIRRASRELAWDPSARNYVALAREHVIAGNTETVLRICTEGLEVHPGDADLQRLADRALQLNIEKRIRTLQEDVKVSPRPALWREMCELLLESGKRDRACKVAAEWHRVSKDGESLLYRARVSAETFFADRSAADGRQAFDSAQEAQKLLKGDPRPLELQLEVASRCGAWQEARKCLARLLELRPGDPTFEARFRSVLAMSEGAKPLDEALRLVERTGRFTDDEPDAPSTAKVAVRPMLKELSSDSDVCAAIYMRGGTALVQGPRGATADRTARAVRDVVQAGRTVARRITLGRPMEVLLEGDFGSLLLSPGELSTSAVWCRGRVKRHHGELLKQLSGMAGLADGDAA